MQITMLLEVIDPGEYDGTTVDSTFVREYVENADSLLVPGVVSWTNVETDMPDPETIRVRADLDYVDTITSGDWKGQEVNAEWVREYVIGADVHFIAHDVLMPKDVKVQD